MKNVEKRTRAQEEDNVAVALADRIDASLVDPCIEDEADRAPEDRSPGYANWLMCSTPSSIEKAADLDPFDWRLISKALKHYAGCNGNAGR